MSPAGRQWAPPALLLSWVPSGRRHGKWTFFSLEGLPPPSWPCNPTPLSTPAIFAGGQVGSSGPGVPLPARRVVRTGMVVCTGSRRGETVFIGEEDGISQQDTARGKDRLRNHFSPDRGSRGRPWSSVQQTFRSRGAGMMTSRSPCPRRRFSVQYVRYHVWCHMDSGPEPLTPLLGHSAF